MCVSAHQGPHLSPVVWCSRTPDDIAWGWFKGLWLCCDAGSPETEGEMKKLATTSPSAVMPWTHGLMHMQECFRRSQYLPCAIVWHGISYCCPKFLTVSLAFVQKMKPDGLPSKSRVLQLWGEHISLKLAGLPGALCLLSLPSFSHPGTDPATTLSPPSLLGGALVEVDACV